MKKLTKMKFIDALIALRQSVDARLPEDGGSDEWTCCACDAVNSGDQCSVCFAVHTMMEETVHALYDRSRLDSPEASAESDGSILEETVLSTAGAPDPAAASALALLEQPPTLCEMFNWEEGQEPYHSGLSPGSVNVMWRCSGCNCSTHNSSAFCAICGARRSLDDDSAVDSCSLPPDLQRLLATDCDIENLDNMQLQLIIKQLRERGVDLEADSASEGTPTTGESSDSTLSSLTSSSSASGKSRRQQSLLHNLDKLVHKCCSAKCKRMVLYTANFCPHCGADQGTSEKPADKKKKRRKKGKKGAAADCILC